MAQAARKFSEDQVPSGGIAEFIMTDDEIAALEAEENRELADQEFGDEGIAKFQDVAARMASYGRYGDDTVAHVETGELIVPKALIDQSPELKASIFNHLRELGIEDPERYVVGSMENSINPETGLPEFFFKKIFKAVTKPIKKVVKGVGKAISGIAKGVKKVFSAVGKVLKKVAPVVLPIALAMTPLGPIYGAALGSGIGTLVQGGDLKDAFKSALISGASGAVFSGVSSKLGGGTFTGGVKAAAADPLGRLAQTGAGVGQAVSGQGFGTLTGGYQAPAAASGPALTPAETVAQATDVSQATNLAGQAPVAEFTGPMTPADQAISAMDASMMAPAAPAAPAPTTAMTPMSSAEQAVGLMDASFNPQVAAADTNAFLQTQGLGAPPEPTSFFERMQGYASDAGDYMFRGGKSPQDVALAQDAAENAYLAKAARTGIAPTEAGLAAARSAAGPGLLARFGPTTALAGVGAAASGFFTPPPVEDPNLVQRNADGSPTTGEDLIALNPDDYLVGGGDPRYSSGQYVVGTNYGMNQFGGQFRNPFMRPQMQPQFMPPQMYAAAGGEVYPRRNGGIMPNEGVPNEDSVRALLMPGEFVMTKDAVKGLGGGSMTNGINNMYSMMRNLEAKGRTA